MASEASEIGKRLQHVSQLRGARAADSTVGARVDAIKQYQHARFERDYAGLLNSTRHGLATRFFLDDLYGPLDFAERDAQFGRVIPALARLLPAEVMHTVASLAELHALSEDLDQQMALALTTEAVDDRSYRAAWQNMGRKSDRERQLRLLLEIGTSLDRHTRTPVLATTLKLMRAPARTAGFAQLQSFLERGLAAFTAMHGAGEFLDAVTANERRVIAELFAAPQSEKPG
jgi:hypothetical protein